MGELFTLPFAGENEVFSIYGNRDCDGDGRWDAAKHGGWDVRPPKVGGVVPTKQGQAVCSGRVDWKNVYNAITQSNDTNSYGNAVRIVTEGGVRAYTAKQPASVAWILKEAADGLRVMKYTPASEDAAEALARAMLALRLPVYAAVSKGDAANLKLVAESHKMTVEEV